MTTMVGEKKAANYRGFIHLAPAKATWMKARNPEVWAAFLALKEAYELAHPNSRKSPAAMQRAIERTEAKLAAQKARLAAMQDGA